MDFFETVYTRKTIRKYGEEHPPIEDIKKIIDSARLAPSAVNAQNWRFIAIYNKDIKQKMTDEVLKAYEELGEIIKDENVRKNLFKYKPHSTFFKDAPVVIACIETQRISEVTQYLKQYCMSYEEALLYKPDSSLLSMGAGIENMSLSATALGYGSCWLCAPIIAYKGFKKVLNLNDDEKIVSLLAIGKPLAENQNRPPKKTLDEIISIIE